MTYWVDKKIDLIITFLQAEQPDEETLHMVVEDLRICHDQVRDLPVATQDEYRARCNKLLVCVGMLKKRGVKGFRLSYIDSLEGVLLGIMCGRNSEASPKDEA